VPELHLPARYYRDAAGEVRWRVTAPNGRIVADSAEGYERVADAAHGLALTARLAAEASAQVILTAEQAAQLLELVEAVPAVVRRREPHIGLLAELRAQAAQAADLAAMLIRVPLEADRG